MKLCATSSDREVAPKNIAVPWPLSEPTLTYFPDARFAVSDRDHGTGMVRRARTLTTRTQTTRIERRATMSDSDAGHDAPAAPHVPVLLDRCVELLTPALTHHGADGAGAVLVDATLGAGGHTERFLTDLPALRVVALDRDPTALDLAGARLAGFGDRVRFVRTTYDGYWSDRPEPTVDGVLFDLGVSSMQLDRAERGFSYAQDAPLDMRMDPDAPLTAAEVVNTWSEKDIARALREFGDERFASRIAAEIGRRRARNPLRTTGELVEVLYTAIPAATRRTGGHPAKRTFQALRTVVNAELDSLRAALPAALDALAPGGRIVVMAYQSLEDKIVKSVFADATASRTPAGLPVELPGHEAPFVALVRGAEKASDAEIDVNPRSASVRLRALEKVDGREVS